MTTNLTGLVFDDGPQITVIDTVGKAYSAEQLYMTPDGVTFDYTEQSNQNHYRTFLPYHRVAVIQQEI